MAPWTVIERWRRDASNTGRQFALETATYVLQHGEPLYRPLFEIAANPLVNHIWRMFIENVFPIALVNGTYSYAASYLDEQDNAIATTLKWGMWGAASIYTVGNSIQFTARFAVLSLQAGKTLTALPSRAEYKQLCVNEHCTSMRFLQGVTRDWVAFLATQRLISAVGFLPGIGVWVEAPLRVYHNGRYVLTMIIPECDRHLWSFMQEYVELALALGISHAAIHQLWVAAASSLTGLRAEDYTVQLGHLSLIVEMMVAAKMKLPPPVTKSERVTYDPLIAYQRLVRFLFDTLAKGLKVTLPPVLKQMSTMGAANFLVQKVKALPEHTLWQNPLVHYPTSSLKQLLMGLLPEMLYRIDAFAEDPVIHPTWAPLREDLIKSIMWMQKEHQNYSTQLVISLASLDPKTSAAWTSFWFGVPELFIELLVKLVANQAFIHRLVEFRQVLENMRHDLKPALPPVMEYPLRELPQRDLGIHEPCAVEPDWDECEEGDESDESDQWDECEEYEESNEVAAILHVTREDDHKVQPIILGVTEEREDDLVERVIYGHRGSPVFFNTNFRTEHALRSRHNATVTRELAEAMQTPSK